MLISENSSTIFGEPSFEPQLPSRWGVRISPPSSYNTPSMSDDVIQHKALVEGNGMTASAQSRANYGLAGARDVPAARLGQQIVHRAHGYGSFGMGLTQNEIARIDYILRPETQQQLMADAFRRQQLLNQANQQATTDTLNGFANLFDRLGGGSLANQIQSEPFGQPFNPAPFTGMGASQGNFQAPLLAGGPFA